MSDQAKWLLSGATILLTVTISLCSDPAGANVAPPATPVYQQRVYVVRDGPVPTPEPVVEAAIAWPEQLNEAQARHALTITGWPLELHEDALKVFCGWNNFRFPNGESNCSPGAVGDSGNSLGFAQLNAATWAPYCGLAREELMELEKNLTCAYQVYLYDIAKGYQPWNQWSVKPW